MKENNEEVKEEKTKKEPDVKTKRKKAKIAVLSLSTLVVLFVGLQVYASTNGYGNVFFMIKEWVTGEKVTEEGKIFSDQEITLSYKSIELAEGLKIQVNRLEIKDGKTKLYANVKSEKSNPLPLKYEIYSEAKEGTSLTKSTSKKITGVMPKNEEYYSYTEALELDYAIKENATLIVKISDSSDKELKTLEINLATREITVKGEEKLEKISKIELRKYLDLFSDLNNDTGKGDTLIQIARKFQSKHEDFMKNEEYTKAIQGKTDREIKNALIKEIYGDKADFETQISKKSKEVEVLKGIDGWTYNKENDAYETMFAWEDYKNGKCLKIESAIYENGVYTIKYIYTLATVIEEDEEKLEDLAQYEATIKLKRIEDNKFSKYQVLSITDGIEVKEKVDSKINENNNDDEWEYIFNTDDNSTDEFEYLLGNDENNTTANKIVVQESDNVWYTVKIYDDDTMTIRLTNPDLNAGDSNRLFVLNEDYIVKGLNGKVKKMYQANNGTSVDPMTFFLLEDGTIDYILPLEQLSDERMLHEFKLDGKIGTVKNVKDIKEDQYGVIIAVLNNNSEVRIWNEFMAEFFKGETENITISNEVKDYINSEGWNQVWPENLGMKFKLPKNFEVKEAVMEGTNRTYAETEGTILHRPWPDSNAERTSVKITFYNIYDKKLEGTIVDDLDRNVESKDNRGWSKWSPIQSDNNETEDGWIIRRYGRTRGDDIEEVRFEMKATGVGLDIYQFMGSVLESVSSTSV